MSKKCSVFDSVFAIGLLHCFMTMWAVLLIPAMASARFNEQEHAITSTLPQTLHGFKLGISVDEARKIATKLGYSCKWKRKTWNTEKAPCADVKFNDFRLRPGITLPSSMLLVDLPEGFQIQLVFVNGSLTYIMSELDKLTAKEAEAFDKDIVAKLGEPAVKYMVSDRQATWRSIWMNGPVRLAYQNKGGGMLSLELVSYPQWVELRTNAVNQDPTIQYGSASAQDILSAMAEDWGDGRSEAPKLPRELAGLQLGDAFPKALSARPDLRNTTRDVGNDVIVSNTDQSTVISLRSGNVMEICEAKRIPGNQLEAYQGKLSSAYGNPRYAQRNQRNQVVGFSWWNKYEGLAMDVGFLSGDDNPSPFSHLFSREYVVDTTRPPENIVVHACVKDVRLAVKLFIEGTPDGPFRRIPQRKSFF